MLSSGMFCIPKSLFSDVRIDKSKSHQERIKDYTINISTPTGMCRVLRGLFSWSLTSGQK